MSSANNSLFVIKYHQICQILKYLSNSMLFDRKHLTMKWSLMDCLHLQKFCYNAGYPAIWLPRLPWFRISASVNRAWTSWSSWSRKQNKLRKNEKTKKKEKTEKTNGVQKKQTKKKQKNKKKNNKKNKKQQKKTKNKRTNVTTLSAVSCRASTAWSRQLQRRERYVGARTTMTTPTEAFKRTSKVQR